MTVATRVTVAIVVLFDQFLVINTYFIPSKRRVTEI